MSITVRDLPERKYSLSSEVSVSYNPGALVVALYEFDGGYEVCLRLGCEHTFVEHIIDKVDGELEDAERYASGLVKKLESGDLRLVVDSIRAPYLQE